MLVLLSPSLLDQVQNAAPKHAEHKPADKVLTSGVLKSQILPRRGWQLGGKTVNVSQFLHLSNKPTVACSDLSLDVQQPSENDYEQKEQGPNFHHWKQEGSSAVIRDRLTLQPGNKINSQQGFLTAATPGNAAAAWLGEGL